MNAEKVLELLKSEEFLLKLEDTNSNEEAQKLFAAEGVTLEMDKVQDIREALTSVLEDPKEISEEDLENVSGGGALKTALRAVMIVTLAYGTYHIYDKIKGRGGFREGIENAGGQVQRWVLKAENKLVDLIVKPAVAQSV